MYTVRGVIFMKHRFTGIAISDTNMIGIDLAYKKGEFLVQDVFQLRRQGQLVDDCQRFIKHFSIEGQRMAAAVISERQDFLLVTPSLSRFETADLLKWQIGDYVDWPEDYYYYDFVIEDTPPDFISSGDVEQQFVYVVALPQALVKDVATGLLKGHGNLEIIDFFPGALTRRFVEHNGSVIALFKARSVELTGWYRHMCITKCELPLDLEAVKTGVEQLETDLYAHGVPGIAGIACFEVELADNSEQTLEIKELLKIYGELTPINNIAQVSVCNEVAEAEPLLWHMALGLAIRGLYKPSY